jgi:hypothetical protein
LFLLLLFFLPEIVVVVVAVFVIVLPGIVVVVVAAFVVVAKMDPGIVHPEAFVASDLQSKAEIRVDIVGMLAKLT